VYQPQVRTAGNSGLHLNLEIKDGRFAGKIISVPEGQVVTVGRTQRSSFAIPHDTFLSGLHFAMECNGQACRLVDRTSANGTFLNGAKVADAIVQNGDEITAGKTVFVVRIIEGVANPARAGHWRLVFP
jgi:pSer/pThr/pTyr-binding forkhead associated (FHA) protein